MVGRAVVIGGIGGRKSLAMVDSRHRRLSTVEQLDLRSANARRTRDRERISFGRGNARGGEGAGVVGFSGSEEGFRASAPCVAAAGDSAEHSGRRTGRPFDDSALASERGYPRGSGRRNASRGFGTYPGHADARGSGKRRSGG